jgi:hypothetical protein
MSNIDLSTQSNGGRRASESRDSASWGEIRILQCSEVEEGRTVGSLICPIHLNMMSTGDRRPGSCAVSNRVLRQDEQRSAAGFYGWHDGTGRGRTNRETRDSVRPGTAFSARAWPERAASRAYQPAGLLLGNRQWPQLVEGKAMPRASACGDPCVRKWGTTRDDLIAKGGTEATRRGERPGASRRHLCNGRRRSPHFKELSTSYRPSELINLLLVLRCRITPPFSTYLIHFSFNSLLKLLLLSSL